jgi:TonB-dependent starch-binding outer membrane protein SusC
MWKCKCSFGIDEVVAIGYGTVQRRDITGSVASVSGEALQAIPVASATEAITGKLAGVQIAATEGSPDAEIRIRVRGGGSITGDNTPLFIVDGFPVESISDIPPSDIESIDVLKGCILNSYLRFPWRQWCNYYYYQNRSCRRRLE